MSRLRAGKNRVVFSSDSEEHGETGQSLETAATETIRADLKTSTTSKKRKASIVENVAQDRSSRSQAKAPQITKPAAKRAKGTIHSFFNAATDQQKLSQTVAGDIKPKAVFETSDDIIDVSDGDQSSSAVQTLNGSTTLAAHRKRKVRFNDPSYEDKTSSLSCSTSKFKAGSENTAKQPVDDVRRPWTDQFPPLNLGELAVHKKKVAQVRLLIEEAVSSRARPRLIILKGPAGTGKTTTLRLLTQDLGLRIRDWENPVGAAGDVTFVSAGSASTQFEDFVLRGASFSTLEFAHGEDIIGDILPSDEQPGHVVLIEEFPNTFASSSNVLQSFRGTIQQYLSLRVPPDVPCTPLVMIISEALVTGTDSFTAHGLLGPTILNHPLTAEVGFNNVAPTILVKALELVAIKEARKSGRRRTPGPMVLKHLAETGDVRSAVSSLEFLCLRAGDNDATWSAKVAFTKSKNGHNKSVPLTKHEQQSLALIGNRESTLGIFHAVGKVVYNKRQDVSADAVTGGNLKCCYRGGKAPENDADSLLTELGTEISTFVAALHENFVLSCSNASPETMLESLNDCLDALSDSDLMQCNRYGGSGGRGWMNMSALDVQRQDDMAFQTAVRGLQYGLPLTVKRDLSSGTSAARSDAVKMFYPTSAKIWRKEQAMHDLLDLVTEEGPYKTSSRDGVESWKKNAAPSFDDSTGNPARSSFAKLETLLERLPYTARVLDGRPQADQRLVERIRELTSFDGLDVARDETDVGHDDDETSGPRFHDLTDEQDGITTKQSTNRIKPRMMVRGGKRELEGGGLRLPVEHEIEKLILSDDDIVDD